MTTNQHGDLYSQAATIHQLDKISIGNGIVEDIEGFSGLISQILYNPAPAAMNISLLSYEETIVELKESNHPNITRFAELAESLLEEYKQRITEIQKSEEEMGRDAWMNAQSA